MRDNGNFQTFLIKMFLSIRLDTRPTTYVQDIPGKQITLDQYQMFSQVVIINKKEEPLLKSAICIS